MQSKPAEHRLWRLIFEITDLLRDSVLEARPLGDYEVAMDLTTRQKQLIKRVSILTEERPEGISLKELADAMRLTSGAVSAMVESLVRKKCLERHISEEDRRSVRIRLSAEGRQAISEAGDALDRIIRDSLAVFPPDEGERLFTALQAFYSQLSQQGEKYKNA